MTVSSRTLKALGATNLANCKDSLIFDGDGIFQPTATTAALLQVIAPLLNKKTKMLDLGCGWGIIGLETKLANFANVELSMSDFSEPAVCAAKQNARNLKIESDIRGGSVFEPWSDSSFDLIVSDISGISNKLPFLDKWFAGIPCESGEDGLKLVTEAIENAPRHFSNFESKLIMPIISLSNVNRASILMNDHFRSVKKVVRRNWNIEIDDKDTEDKMEELKEKKHVDFTKSEKTYSFYTDVYQLSQPRI